MDFLKRYDEVVAAKNSVVMVAVDPALQLQRRKNVIPAEYTSGRGDEDGTSVRFRFSIDTIAKTYRNSAAIKLNAQYTFGMSVSALRAINQHAREREMLALFDPKLGDTELSNDSGIFYIAASGFDGLIVNPLLGNMQQIVKEAHAASLAAFPLVMTSNPEAPLYMKRIGTDGRPLYELFAQQAKESGADGIVVGAAEHVTEKDISRIGELVGEDMVWIVTGTGTQQGDPLKFKGKRVLVGIGQDIIYDQDPEAKSKEWKDKLAGLVKRI